MKRLEVIKPLRINHHLLEVGDVFDVAEVYHEDTSQAGWYIFSPCQCQGNDQRHLLAIHRKNF